MWISRRLNRRPASWVLRYGLVISSVAVALLLTLSLRNPNIRSTLFFPAIMVSAWYGGLWTGLAAAGLSYLAINSFLVPSGQSPMSVTVDDAVYLLVFAVSASLVAWLTATQRRADAEVVRQASLLDLTHDTVFVRDQNDVITYWNHGAAELYGWAKEEVVGRVTHELLKTVFPVPLAEIEATLHRTGRWEGELVHTKRDGSLVVVASRWSLQRDGDGVTAGVLETNNDLTKRRAAEDALRQAHAELAHVTRVTMLGEITASIAHEVNQPLAAVVMNGNACLRWLASDPPNIVEGREAAQRIVSDGNRAGQVIARVRTLLKREVPERRPVDVNELISETLAFTRTDVARNDVSTRTELRENIPAVMGDRVQLQQVLVNLILNGTDAMSEVDDRRRVLTVRSRSEDTGRVLVEVEDCGKGLAAGQSDRIFDAFFSTKPGGLGMGLSVSRSIIELHGGKIFAQSNEGPGVTLTVSLPAASGGK